jgi:tripartite-type tricarboxylate transporter receptor subunit TctC
MQAFAAVLMLVGGQAVAQSYPAKPVRIVLSSPGGGTDVMARLFAEQFTRSLGIQFFVESKQPNIAAANFVAKSKADGYTLLVATASYIVNSLLHRNPPYDPIKDFSAVSLLGTTPIIVAVHPSLPARSLNELVEFARKHPDELSYGSGGIGSPLHLAGELFNQTAGVKMLHVPFKGTAHAAIDLQAGRVQVMFPSSVSVLPQVKAGRIRVLAIMSTRRSAELPDVPTTGEAGLPNLVVNIWYGLMAPQGTPLAIVDRLQREVAKGLARPEIRAHLVTTGVEPVGSTAAEFSAFTLAERARWAAVIRSANISIEP